MRRTRDHPSIGMVTQSTHLHPSNVAVTVSAWPSNDTEDNNTLHVVDLVRQFQPRIPTTYYCVFLEKDVIPGFGGMDRTMFTW
jgi:hypothetical protein